LCAGSLKCSYFSSSVLPPRRSAQIVRPSTFGRRRLDPSYRLTVSPTSRGEHQAVSAPLSFCDHARQRLLPEREWVTLPHPGFRFPLRRRRRCDAGVRYDKRAAAKTCLFLLATTQLPQVRYAIGHIARRRFIPGIADGQRHTPPRTASGTAVRQRDGRGMTSAPP
jgi:hypothetical protein